MWHWTSDFAGINSRERQKKSRNRESLYPRKFIPIKYMVKLDVLNFFSCRSFWGWDRFHITDPRTDCTISFCHNNAKYFDFENSKPLALVYEIEKNPFFWKTRNIFVVVDGIMFFHYIITSTGKCLASKITQNQLITILLPGLCYVGVLSYMKFGIF